MNPPPNIFGDAQNPRRLGEPQWTALTVEELNAEFALTPKVDHYCISRFIDQSNMSAVYEATNTKLGNRVVIKALSPLLNEGTFAQRFEAEAKTLARLKHPNIVHVYDHGQTQDGTLYIIMEYLDGVTLAQAIQQEGAFSETKAVEIAIQLCIALQYTHQRETADGEPFLHRDIKPGNIILVNGMLKLIDFGIARGHRETGVDLTLPGESSGTPHYMAPELSHGEKPTVRSDIFALGKVIDEMLHGTPVHSNSRETPITPALQVIVDRAKADQASRRQSTVEEVRAELNAYRLAQHEVNSPKEEAVRDMLDPSSIVIVYDDDWITINGISFGASPLLSEITQLFGTPDARKVTLAEMPKGFIPRACL